MLFERYNEREKSIVMFLNEHGISDLKHVKSILSDNNLDAVTIVRSVQPIAFDDACWAFAVGIAAAINDGILSIEHISETIGCGLQSFAIEGSVADNRKIGIGHGMLAKTLLDPNTKHFAFVAGHESFAAAEGALSVVNYANSYREIPLDVIVVGLGKPAARIISRYKGFNYIETYLDHYTDQLVFVGNKKYGKGLVDCYGAHSVEEGVLILLHSNVDTIITGNSTSHIKFTDPTVATYKKRASEMGKNVFCVASGGGTGRTMHPDNVGSGAASYGMTDTTGRMHSNLQFAGSSSVPAHVEMVGFIGIGNNPLVGAMVSAVCQVYKKLQHKGK